MKLALGVLPRKWRIVSPCRTSSTLFQNGHDPPPRFSVGAQTNGAADEPQVRPHKCGSRSGEAIYAKVLSAPPNQKNRSNLHERRLLAILFLSRVNAASTITGSVRFTARYLSLTL